MVMKLCYIGVLFVFFGMLCLFDNNQQDFQSCISAADERYPASKPLPLGQPYQDIYKCMLELGYAQDSQPLACQEHTDYTTLVMDSRCYRPTNFFRGYIHDVHSTLR